MIERDGGKKEVLVQNAFSAHQSSFVSLCSHFTHIFLSLLAKHTFNYKHKQQTDRRRCELLLSKEL